MQVIYADFETFYDKTYTLKKLTPIEYVLDPRWETIGCSIAVNDKIAFIEGDGVANLLRRVKRPWCFISYNALFDASILAYKYNIHPDFLVDALGIVRAVLVHKIRNGRADLATVAAVLGLPPKDKSVLANVSGWHLEDIKRNPNIWAAYKRYCIHDTELLRDITKQLLPQFPAQELRIMDMILKMCTRPQFYSDTYKLSEHLIAIVNAKNQLLQRVNCTRAQLLSAEQFAEILKSFGVSPPMKASPTTGKDIYAFAKDDPGMQELLEYPDPDIQALAAARVGIKSTLEEARTQRFISIGQITQNTLNKPWMPIALRYGAAHTHRFGGEWKINQQNLPARKGKKLRESLYAPPDHVVLEVDAAQIEARLVAWLAHQEDLLREFSKPGNDVYSWFGSDLFKYTITKATHPIERFNSKTIVLGLGFQMGPNKLLSTMTKAAKEAEIDQTYTVGQCEVWVDYYRSKFNNIKRLWYHIQKLIPLMADPANKGKVIARIGPCVLSYQKIILPSGLNIYYNDLRQDNFGQWIYTWGRETRKIYGGKMLENMVQALDRQHVMETAVRIEDRLRKEELPETPLAHQAHDALIYVPHISILDRFKIIVEEEMARPCPWGKGLPLDSETKIGPNYGELK